MKNVEVIFGLAFTYRGGRVLSRDRRRRHSRWR